MSLLAEGSYGTTKLTGYYEADWLGTGVTSNNRQSNSYVNRMRQIWGQAKLADGLSFTAGQMWSLATEDKKGIDVRQEAIPLTVDSQYNVGFTWARQYGFRVVKDFDGKFALAFAVEGPQATIGGRGFSNVTTINSAAAPAVVVASGVTTSSTGNTFLDAPGSGGGLLNFIDATGYSVNKSPDFIIKASADPGFGHYELLGIVSVFRNRFYPCGVVGTNATDTAPPAAPTAVPCPVNGLFAVSGIGAANDTVVGGGVGASARWPLFGKKLDFGIKAVGGDGIGRYGSAQLADLTFKPDGHQALIRTAHALGVSGMASQRQARPLRLLRRGIRLARGLSGLRRSLRLPRRPRSRPQPPRWPFRRRPLPPSSSTRSAATARRSPTTPVAARRTRRSTSSTHPEAAPAPATPS